jgi:hypothetical protein
LSGEGVVLLQKHDYEQTNYYIFLLYIYTKLIF